MATQNQPHGKLPSFLRIGQPKPPSDPTTRRSDLFTVLRLRRRVGRPTRVQLRSRMVPAVRRYVFIASRGRDAWVFGRATAVLVFFHLVRRLWEKENTHNESEREQKHGYSSCSSKHDRRHTLVNLALWSSFGPSRVLQRGREGRQLKLPSQHYTNSRKAGH